MSLTETRQKFAQWITFEIVGTLVQGAFVDQKCAIGLILGTGSNACYIEDVSKIEKWEGDHQNIKQVIIFICEYYLDFLKCGTVLILSHQFMNFNLTLMAYQIWVIICLTSDFEGRNWCGMGSFWR